MGRLTARELSAASVDLTTAVRIHLASNHYPPLPYAYTETAKEAISRGADALLGDDPDLWLAEIELPEEAEVVPRAAVDGVITLGALIEALHLHEFVEVVALHRAHGEDLSWTE